MDKMNFAGNTDTGFLKAVAFITMLADHVGYLFFPEQIIWRLIGRISFPLFAYCLVLGFFHTRDIRKYFTRFFWFSLVSQIPYTLCFFPKGAVSFLDEFCLNIGFTMMLGLWAIRGLEKKKYLHTALAVLLSFLPFVEYGFYGVFIIVALYLFSDKNRAFFGFTAGIALASPFFNIFIDGTFDPQGFALLALPFMLIKTESNIKIPRRLGYGFYPVHLLLLAAIDYLI